MVNKSQEIMAEVKFLLGRSQEGCEIHIRVGEPECLTSIVGPHSLYGQMLSYRAGSAQLYSEILAWDEATVALWNSSFELRKWTNKIIFSFSNPDGIFIIWEIKTSSTEEKLFKYWKI